MKGKPVRILTSQGDSFQLQLEELKLILENEKIRDMKVVVISIAGEMRHGKSFMLNLFLRYLNAENKQTWLNDENSELEGFSWKNGIKIDTSGIVMWSEPFILKNTKGEEFAVLLMDTQGTFDNTSSMKNNALVFAMSTLISSMLIFNISKAIHEHQLQFLRLFTKYGRLASESHGDSEEDIDKPFQHIQFLMRDWQDEYEYEYGLDGGKRYVDEVLADPKQHEGQSMPDDDMRKLRQYIRDLFTRIDCCLLPHPGKKVTSWRQFTGKVGDIDVDFVNELKRYVPHVLNPNNMLPKAVSGEHITSRELLEFFKAYFNVFSGNDLPAPKDIYVASAEASNTVSLLSCRRFYQKEMGRLVSPENRAIPQEKLMAEHAKLKEATVKRFRKIKRMGGREYESEYVPRLEQELDKDLSEFLNLNKSKENNTKALRTALVLGVFWLMLYVLQGIFSFVGFSTVTSCVSLALYALITLALVWLGSLVMHKEPVSRHIEDWSNIAYDELLCPVARASLHYAVSGQSVTARGPGLETR